MSYLVGAKKALSLLAIAASSLAFVACEELEADSFASSDEASLVPVTFSSYDNGWVEGEDVSSKFDQVVSNMVAGDHLYLHARFKIQGRYTLPDDVVISAAQGAGFDIIDSATNNDPILKIGNSNIISNVTFNHVGTPQTGTTSTNPKNGVDFFARKGVEVVGKENVQIINSHFIGNIAIHLDNRSSKNTKINGTLFEGGFYQARISGASDDVLVKRTVFKSSLGDGIKTTFNSGYGPQRTLVTESIFDQMNRDGIDTAGGFKDGVVKDTVFRNNKVAALDIKELYEEAGDTSEFKRNKNIKIQNCIFIDVKELFVLTTNDRLSPQIINDSNRDEYLVHKISLLNSKVYVSPSANTRIALIKDAHTVSVSGLDVYGSINSARIFGLRDFSDSFQDTRPNVTQTNYNISIEAPTTRAYEAPGDIYTFEYGPI